MESRRAVLNLTAARTRRSRWRLIAPVLLVSMAGCGSVRAAPDTTPPSPPLILVPIADASVLGASTAVSPTVAIEPTPSTDAAVSSSVAPNPTGRAGWVPPAPLVGNPFADPVGSWVGGDIPRIYPLPDGRQVWWLNDSFVPKDARAPVDQFEFVRNVVFVRGLDGSLDMRMGNRSGKPWDFLPHADGDHFHRFYWPLGGDVDGALLKVFVAEMECDQPKWSICFRPVSTWLATYTWADMQLVDMQPAPNAGVRPVYGFSVVSDADWTYLYGAGVEYNTPHVPGGSDQTYVARVPRGKLEQAPTYWDGTEWNPDPTRAEALIQRGYADFRLSVVAWKGRYLGVAKEDEFVGPAVFVMTAPAPQGPWTTAAAIPLPVPRDAPDEVTYDAEPYPVPIDGKLAIVYSKNSTIEHKVFDDPSVYRPVLLLTNVE